MAVSVVVPMAGVEWGWLPLLTGMAMARALQQVAGVDARLKWPNDVLVDGAKICGVLCEMARQPPGTDADVLVVAGMGINVAQPGGAPSGHRDLARRRGTGSAGRT